MNDNINTSKATNYVFKIGHPRLEKVEFYCQRASIPGLQLGSMEQPWQSGMMAMPGDSLTFGELSLTILLDEDLKSFRELYAYIMERKDPHANTYNPQDTVQSYLFVTTNKNNIRFKFTFYNCWVSDIGGLEFGVESEDVQTMDVTLKMDYYRFEEIKVKQ